MTPNLLRSLPLVAAVGILALTLDACGSGGSRSSSDSAEHGSAASAGRADSFAAKPAAPKAAGAPKASAPKADTPAVQQPAIISTGSLLLSAKNVSAARDQVQRVAGTYQGQISSEESSTEGTKRLVSAHIVLRVPSDSFTKAMADLEKAGTLEDSTTSSKDVSTQVIDVDERVKSAKASLARIRTLLTRAEKIGDVMAIESELSEREADLNSLLAQQAHLADQTSLSTITVDIERHVSAHPRKKADHGGFLAGLSGGWQALRTFGSGVATVIGALLPWVPVVAVVALPCWLLLRRRRAAG